MLTGISAAPADSILGLTEAFKADSNPNKVNLGVGVYKDDSGATVILRAVKAAEEIILKEEQTKSYLPISGDPAYGQVVQEMLFGADSPVVTEKKARTCHSPGGTGGLRVGADYISNISGGTSIWVSTPTWANHKGIFSAAGLSIKEYPYYNPETKSLDAEALLASLKEIPAGDVVLLHVCCHNPTGVDLGMKEWDAIAEISAEKGWVPFFDFAYQGFGDGVEEDRAAFEPFIAKGTPFFVASSFSKNFGLYNERAGAITLVSENSDEAAAAFSHMKLAVRTNYSNPACHGGSIARTILQNPELKAQWLKELDEMRERIKKMRSTLVEGIKARGIDQDFSYIIEQRGMFSYSGLSDEQVKWLRDKKAIYIVGGGRINVAGLTSGNIEYVCDAIAECLNV